MGIKIAHYGRFCPHSNGMFFTTKDLILAERKAGIDAQFIDWGHAKEYDQQFSRVGLKHGDVETIDPRWGIEEADILVLHSAMPKDAQECGKPIIMAMHGRPEYSFILEKMGKGSSSDVYSLLDKNPNTKAFLTFWYEHIDFWKLQYPKRKIVYAPAMVDLEIYRPDGEPFQFKNSGEPNIVVADIWREDISPFNVVMAAAKFIKEKCPNGRLHIFGLSKPNETTALPHLINKLKKQNIIGSVHGLIKSMDRVYRSADILITPHCIATRVVREALASGCPIIAGTGNFYTKYIANPRDIEEYSDEINRFWDENNKPSELQKRKKEAREIAEIEFNFDKSGKAMVEIAKNIMNVKSVVLKNNNKIYTHIVYDLDKDLGRAYNEFMKQLPNDSDWACFLDHDAMFTTHDWFAKLHLVIESNPQYKCFTAMTNRIGNSEQIVKGYEHNHDIAVHRVVGAEQWQEHNTNVKDATNAHAISGVVMLIQKLAWKKAGGFKHGFLGVDNDFHVRLTKTGFKTGIMRGVYVYHWYRYANSELKPIEV